MKQLLIVEDDLTLNEGLCKALRQEDRKIISCDCLKAARAQLALGIIDFVLLDINLPDGSGLELLKEIKKQKASLPVVLLTANDTDRDIVHGLETGADDYITKPFSLSVLRARVNTQLRKIEEKADGEEYVDENALSVTVKRLRDKLELGNKIKTVYGIGYAWVTGDADGVAK